VLVSDASGRRAAAWLAAWARAGLLGTDPEVVGYVCDLLNFVGERTMKKTDDELVQSWQRSVDDVGVRLEANLGVTRCEADLADGFVYLLARVRELEAEVVESRRQLDEQEEITDKLAVGAGDAEEFADQKVRDLEAENARLREGLRRLRPFLHPAAVDGCDELLGDSR